MRPPYSLPVALLLFVTALWVYRPSLDRIFVADQVLYFAELGGSTSLSDGLRHYDYAVTRRYEKGDDVLFRPGVFALLAVENTLFSYHHRYWNIVNLLLHFGTAWCLYRLLFAIQPSPFAAVVAVLFTVIKASLDLVVWNHLGGYILAWLLFAIAMRAFVLMLYGADDRHSLLVYALSFIAAALCYEAIVGACVLAGLLLVVVPWRRGARPSVRRTVVLFSPVMLYALVYGFHILRVERLNFVNGRQAVFSIDNVFSAVATMPHVIYRWMLEIAFPSILQLIPLPFEGFELHFVQSWQDPLVVLGASLVAVITIAAAASLTVRRVTRVLPILCLVVGTAVAYTVLVCLGRVYAVLVPYYSYPFALLFLIGLYTMIDFERARGGATVALAGAFAAFIVVHGTQSHAVTQGLGAVSAPVSGYLTAVGRFVDEHKQEPGFTFVVAEHSSQYESRIDVPEGYPDRRSGVRYDWMTEILFKRYYDAERPKYVLRCQLAPAGAGGQWMCLSQVSFRPPEYTPNFFLALSIFHLR